MATAKNIIIAGGGTGGHIFPAIAIANALKKHAPETNLLFVGAIGKMEMEKIPQAGYKIEGLNIAGFNRSNLLKNIGLPLKLVKSFFQVKKIFENFRPHAVLGVGGYSSFPVLRYAQSKGIPSFIHEANSYAGKTNQLLAKKASLIFTGYEHMGKFFPAETTIFSGNPVRENILNANVTKEEAAAYFQLDIQKPTILSIGGSLGAGSINKAVKEGLQKFEENGIQLIWQTGKDFADEAAEAVKGKTGIWTGSFITRMDMAYAAADLAISRAGAMSIAELCVAGIPAVFVPYPLAAENHQYANASGIEKKGGGLIVIDSEAHLKLIDTIISLTKDKKKTEEMKNALLPLAIRDADDTVALNILKKINE